MFATIYTNVQSDQRFFWFLVIMVFAIAWVCRMIWDGTFSLIEYRREVRRERYEEEDYPEDPEVTRIMQGIRPDEYQFEMTNEEYHAAGQRTLHDRWREFLEEATPRSPEIVAESVYRDTVPFTPVRVEVVRQWPTWTAEQMSRPGRHRAETEEGQPFTDEDLNVLLTPTGGFPVLRRELVSA